MRIIPALFLCTCATVLAPSAAVSESAGSRAAAPEVLRTWVDARAGTGAPVHWVSEGGVYDYPSGEKLLGMIGFDSSTVIWPDDPDGTVIHLTRKTYTYTDPVSGEILTEYKGRPVQPIAYPYQLIRYRMRDGRIYGEVEQGAGESVQRIKSRNGMQVRKLGRGTTAITASVFLDFPIPGGNRYQAWENYDFFIHSDEMADEPHQLSWQRYGALPPFVGEGNAIYHLLSWRVESQDEFPPALLEWAREEVPMWLRPPADLDEVRALQAGTAGEGWPE